MNKSQLSPGLDLAPLEEEMCVPASDVNCEAVYV